MVRRILTGLVLLILLLGVSLYAQKKEEPKKEPVPKQDDVSIWYIGKHNWGNNGVAVKTAKYLLIFDYVFTPFGELPDDSENGILKDGKTIVPKEIENENTFVFITHKHADHYDKAIKTLKDKVKKIRYIVPEGMKQEFEELKECTTIMDFEDTKEVNGRAKKSSLKSY